MTGLADGFATAACAPVVFTGPAGPDRLRHRRLRPGRLHRRRRDRLRHHRLRPGRLHRRRRDRLRHHRLRPGRPHRLRRDRLRLRLRRLRLLPGGRALEVRRSGPLERRQIGQQRLRRRVAVLGLALQAARDHLGQPARRVRQVLD
jgi:hypothetical protein